MKLTAKGGLLIGLNGHSTGMPVQAAVPWLPAVQL